MWPVMAVAGASGLTGALVGSYLIAGVVVAGLLERAGQPRGAVLGALAAWPLMLPLLNEGPAVERGPLGQRIHAVLRQLEQTLGDPLAGEVMWTADLDELRGALLAADGRLALVDRLLGDTPPGEVDQAVRDLEDARAEGQRAIETVLAEVQQLRLQVGMAALAGGREQLQRRLQELSARAAALSELS